MPRISSPRPLDLTKPFVTSSQSYGSKPFDLSENLVTWYRDVQGDFVPDLSGMGNTARCAGSASFLPVVASSDTPELNLTQFDIKSFSFGGGAAGTAYPHIKTVNSVNSPTASIDHSFTDGTNDLPFSISFWIKPDAVSSQQYVISKINSAAPLSGYEWSVEILNGGPLRFIINGEGRSSRYLQAQKNAVISAGEWQHVALTYDGSASTSGISMYVNGSALTALSLSSSSYVKMSKTSTPICIGNRFSSTSYATVSSEEYDGLIHSVAIWKNRKLTSSEIAGLYNAYLNGPGGEARSGFISRSPRLHLRELDDLPGSYSTVRRSGDSTRTGALTSSFNDSTTIVFSDTETAVFPSMLPKGSPFAAQAVDIIGQESDIRVALPIRSFQHPNHLHYSPTEAIGPFDENRAIPASDFFLSGTRSEILPGFNSPKRSKISFEIDVTPSRETTFTRNMSLRNTSEGQPVGPTNTGFMYYNFNRKEWEQIGAKDPALPSVLYYEYDMSGDVGFGNNSSGTLPAQFSVSPSRAFAPDSEKEVLGYSKIGTPISAFGAPNNTMYHATASQCLKLSNFISNPFLLEGVRVEISEAKAQRVQGDSLVGTPDIEYLGRSALQQSGSIKDIDNYVFFMYRQSRKNRVVDSISDVSSSERYLIASGSMTFWNSASFESNRVRYENQDVNFGLTHSPQFSYEFGLPYSSSYDVRLTDWDPSHDTYYYEDLLFDVTSNCVAHFNFEDDVVGGGSVVDKTGNGHVAAVDTYPVSKVVGPDNVSYSVGFPSTNYLGVDFFDSGAYISNRGYLSCGAIDSTSPSMRIDHASDLQLSFAQGFSIAFWVQPYVTPLPQDQWIISKAQDYPGTQVEYYVQVLTTGEIRWCVSGSGGGYIEKLTSDSWIDSTSWSHVVVTYNGGTNNNALKIFVNGAQVNTTGINSGTFTAPVNYSHDVLVGSLGDLPYSFVGYIGSLEFYNTSISAASAKKLYFLQETPFLNSISTSVGQFTGSINMEITPAVCNRQIFGISSYSNYELQNVWIGGTSFEKFRKNSWDVGSLTGLPANPFFRLTGSSGIGYVEGVALDDRIYSSKIDSRASKFLGNDTNESGNPKSQEVSGISTVNDATNQSVESPYLLMPGDELIFGIDSGICSMTLYDQGNLSHLTGSHFVISPKSCKITLFGSLIKDGNESLSSLNQDLSSNSIHEAIGSEQILDQFQIEPKSSYYGSYLDEIVTGSMITPALGGLIFSSEDQDHSRRVISQVSLGGAGTTGSLQRFVKMMDKSERSYDSCLPSYADFLSGSNELDVGLFNNTTYNIVNFERITVEFADFEAAVLEKNGFLPNQFPFKFNPTRRVDIPRGFIQNNNFPVGFTYLDLVVATDDRDTARQNGFMVTRDLIFRTNYNYHKNYLNVTPYSYGHKIGSGSSGASLVNEKAGAFRYGISNVEPDFTACCWRTDHYGQLRDMLEPRRLTARFDGFNPVKIRFVSGSTVLADPTETHSQNISVFATSSMPYFDDGVARNRSDNPDESLLNLFTIAT